ncbi:hypothetical protein ACQZV8_14845, partial [Magnetococcales bacterium HHB-1]
MRKVAILGMVVATLGLPLNSWFDFSLLVVILALLLTGELRTGVPRRWLAAGSLTMVVIMVALLLPFPRIEEGQTIFLDYENSDAFYGSLPPEIRENLDKTYRQHYASAELPAPAGDPLWAFSGDGFWQSPKLSRVIPSLRFSGRKWAQISALNDEYINFRPGHHALDRHHLPFLLRYDLPEALAGLTVCWQGDLFWPGETQYLLERHKDRFCRALPQEPSRYPLTLYAADIHPDYPLMLELDDDPW